MKNLSIRCIVLLAIGVMPIASNAQMDFSIKTGVGYSFAQTKTIEDINGGSKMNLGFSIDHGIGKVPTLNQLVYGINFDFNYFNHDGLNESNHVIGHLSLPVLFARRINDFMRPSVGLKGKKRIGGQLEGFDFDELPYADYGLDLLLEMQFDIKDSKLKWTVMYQHALVPLISSAEVTKYGELNRYKDLWFRSLTFNLLIPVGHEK